MSSRKALYVCVSLDVEEEGLFGGHYERVRPQLKNISLLTRVSRLAHDFDLPLTLFCTYRVFANKESCLVLDEVRESCVTEIGAHLHHWNTPPLEAQKSGPPERTHLLAPELLNERLDSLLEAARKWLGHPVSSFRMGRWDLKAPLFEMLAAKGIKVDSSICPLRCFAGGADHFLAPVRPYWRPTPAGKILVAPITQLPVINQIAPAWHKAWQKKPAVLDKFHFFGAMSANPFWHSSTIMRMATRKLLANGENILNLFWHSSELMPGASPQTPDGTSAENHFKKIQAFFTWLRANYHVRGITMDQLPLLDKAFHFPVIEAHPDRDW